MDSTPDSAPPSDAAAVLTPSKNTPSGKHTKRNHRPRKDQSHSLPQLDGAVSDSVAHMRSSPQFQNTSRQRHQSVALGTAPHHAHHTKPSNDSRQRPASHGGSMLPNTPLKEQAYAGPTFQASPAPSSLPVPKFFSRSVPNVAAQSSLAQRMESERTPEKESSPETDVPPLEMPDRESQKSPLDVFFKADRQERDRIRSGSGLSPEVTRKQTLPNTQYAMGQQPRDNIFLDGSDNRDLATSNHFPPSNGHSQHNRQFSSPDNGMKPSPPIPDDRDAQTQALKALLFNNINSPQSQTQPQQTATPPRVPSNLRVYETPSPFQRSTSNPTTPAPQHEYQQYNPNYHYGNQRNLSPLFKAASGRNETPASRPSGLRQQQQPSELAASSSSSPSSLQQSHAQPSRMIDPNSFSRNYDASQGNAATPPYLPAANGTSYHNAPSSSAVPPHGGGQGNVSMPPNPARTTADAGGGGGSVSARDVQGMEEDLRRMLNLKVLSG